MGGVVCLSKGGIGSRSLCNLGVFKVNFGGVGIVSIVVFGVVLGNVVSFIVLVVGFVSSVEGIVVGSGVVV